MNLTVIVSIEDESAAFVDTWQRSEKSEQVSKHVLDFERRE